jgi:hypothetical protein
MFDDEIKYICRLCWWFIIGVSDHQQSPNPTTEHWVWRCHCRCWCNQRWVILHRLHDPPITIGADDLGHGVDREDLAWFGKSHGAQKAYHLAHHGFSMHTPYLACHYRWNMSCSLPRGIPTVVDESVEVHVREPDGDTKCKRQRLDRFRPLAWRNTLRPVSLWIVLWEMRWKRGCPYPPYIARG